MMKKHGKIVFPILFGILVALSCISVKLITDIQDYSKLINYVGIVRGASQRVVKLETNGQPDDNMIAYVDGILEELITGKGSYGLAAADSEEYKRNLNRLEKEWGLVKRQIDLVRGGENNATLVKASEDLFRVANETVFSIEDYSNRKASEASHIILVSALCCGIAFAAAIVHYVRKFFQLEKANEQLEAMAGRDEVTGAYTSERFYELLAQIREQNPDQKFAVLYVDFENFKYINDVFGYAYGDEVLKKYAGLVMEQLDRNELLCRNVADHFFILRHYETKEQLLESQMAVDQRFLQEARDMPNRHTVTVACGICCVEDVLEKADGVMLVNRANFAQKTVKNRADNHYAFYDEEIRRKMIAENTLRDRMQEALERREFLVYYQPKVSVRSGTVQGAEALVRWNMPGRGMLPPGEFIPIMEKNYFIAKVDQFVFEEVCKWFHNRIGKGRPVVPVSINVSKLQFYNPEFIRIYSEIKDRYQVPDGMLEIEFTESVAFERSEHMLRVVRELHARGFLCSLDDFGTGYSSFGMLKDLPFDTLKLDGIFFRVSLNVHKEHTIVLRMIQMLRELDICTVAEGVEYEDQVEFLREAGCDFIQGYYYYKPMPEADFEKVLAEQETGGIRDEAWKNFSHRKENFLDNPAEIL